jgi:hypothetical protein
MDAIPDWKYSTSLGEAKGRNYRNSGQWPVTSGQLKPQTTTEHRPPPNRQLTTSYNETLMAMAIPGWLRLYM